MPKTLYDKLWDEHFIIENQVGESLLYIDRHLVHEVTSPQAFSGLRLAKRQIWRPDSIVATADHSIPTLHSSQGITDATAKLQVDTLENNCVTHGLKYYGLNHARQGIVHVIGPEQGVTLPGMTVVCVDV